MSLEIKFEGDPGKPLTRAELAEAMQIVGRAFEQVATKDDIQRIERQMAADKEELLRAIQAALEITRDALLGGTQDEITAMHERQNGQDRELRELRRHVGLPPTR